MEVGAQESTHLADCAVFDGIKVHVKESVILQVGPDARQVYQRSDAVPFDMLLWPNSYIQGVVQLQVFLVSTHPSACSLGPIPTFKMFFSFRFFGFNTPFGMLLGPKSDVQEFGQVHQTTQETDVHIQCFAQMLQRGKKTGHGARSVPESIRSFGV